MGRTFLRKAFGNVGKRFQMVGKYTTCNSEHFFVIPFQFCRNKTELSFSYLKYTGAILRRVGPRSGNVETEHVDVGCHFVGISAQNKHRRILTRPKGGVPPTQSGMSLLVRLEMDLEMRETPSYLRFFITPLLTHSKRFDIAFIFQNHHPERPD